MTQIRYGRDSSLRPHYELTMQDLNVLRAHEWEG